MNDQVKKLTVRLVKTQTSLNTNPVSSDYFLCNQLEDMESWFAHVHRGDIEPLVGLSFTVRPGQFVGFVPSTNVFRSVVLCVNGVR